MKTVLKIAAFLCVGAIVVAIILAIKIWNVVKVREIAELKLSNTHTLEVLVYNDLDAPVLLTRLVLLENGKEVLQIKPNYYFDKDTRIDQYFLIEKTGAENYHVITTEGAGVDMDLAIDTASNTIIPSYSR